MCITSQVAHLTATKILSFKKEDGNVFLSYQNEVVNEFDGKNAMILPIPGKIKEFYDTTLYKDFLNDISNQTVISEMYSYGIMSRGVSRGLGKSLSIEKTKVGMYDITHSIKMSDLKEVSETEKLNISPALLEFFNTHYKDFGFVCCMFASNKKMSAQPIAFDYEPLNKDTLFFPTMDSHDGTAPKNELVTLEHEIITVMKEGLGKKITIKEHYPEFLKDLLFGTYELGFKDMNGDIYYSFDFGNTWTQSSNFINSTPNIIVMIASGKYQLITGGSAIYLSSNYGRNWTSVPSSPSAPVGIAVSYTGQ